MMAEKTRNGGARVAKDPGHGPTTMDRAMSARFNCDLAAKPAALPHFWEHTVGSDHAPMALRADWRLHLRRAHDELGFRHVRFHGILSDDLGTLLCEENELLYSFFNADSAIDFLISIDVRPFVELSFMPTTLASGTTTVFKYRGNVTPPRDYRQWAALITKVVGHWVERYGVVEVRRWFFEVWNEPNLNAFWTGSQEDYFNLYRHTVLAIKAIDKGLRVGGPATAANAWVTEFVDFCRINELPADFVSTHHYPTDAFGKPGDDTETQLSESRRSVLREAAMVAHAQAAGTPLYYTEWSSSSNPRDPLHDEPYAAAFAVKTVLEANGLVAGYSYWTFSDLFEENYLPSVPFHGGFGLLNLQGIAKPAYRAFQLLHRLGSGLMPTAGSHPTVDVWVVTAENLVTVVCTNWALPRHPITTEHVRVCLANMVGPAAVTVERIDEHNGNVKKEWQNMGEPEYLTKKQVDRLHAASAVAKRPQRYQFRNGALTFSLKMPPQGIAVVSFQTTTR